MNTPRDPKRWEIWLARLRFSDKPNVWKNRPVLIMDRRDDEVSAFKITSHFPPSIYTGVALFDWRKEGLKAPSFVCCWPPFAIMRENILSAAPIGALSSRDRDQVREALIDTGMLLS